MATQKSGTGIMAGKAAKKLDKIHIEATAPTPSPVTGVSGEERRQLIAEAAYFRAEQRRFTPGYELEDWLSAEAEVDGKLGKIGRSNITKNA